MNPSQTQDRYLRKRWSFVRKDKHGTLRIAGHSVRDLERRYGTPLYILIEKEIRSRIRRFKNAFPYPHLRVQYASKCNSNLEILRIAREEGIELDASSVGEIILALLADFEPEQITFTNLYKSEQDITFAAKIGVQAITADSFEEIDRIIHVAEKIRKKIRLMIRINPMISLGKYTTKNQQYGMSLHEIKRIKRSILAAIGSKYVDLFGFHFHGSYISDPQVYEMAAERLMKLARFANDNGASIKALDLGGGFPIESKGKKVFQPEDMGEKFIKRFRMLLAKHGLPELILIFEPGKFFVANAGIGLVEVVSKKLRGRKQMLITDGSTYSMLPDPLIYDPYYDIIPASKLHKQRNEFYEVCGSTCDCVDIFGKNRFLPTLEEGDLLAIMDCGAYSNVMASNFNTLKRPPMVMIKEDGTIKLIRRRDRYSEMFAPELDVLKYAGPKELKGLYDFYRVNVNKVWNSGGKGKKKA